MENLMTKKRMFIATFTIDDEIGDKHDVADFLGYDGGIQNVIVWDTAEDFVADHKQLGPINLEYLTGTRDDPKYLVLLDDHAREVGRTPFLGFDKDHSIESLQGPATFAQLYGDEGPVSKLIQLFGGPFADLPLNVRLGS